MASKIYVRTIIVTVFLAFTNGKTIVNETAKLLAGPSTQNVKIGQHVTLQCQWSRPSPDCYWIKDDFPVVLSENDRYSILRDNQTENCSLEIIGIQPADEGNWRCVFSKEQNALESKPIKLMVDDVDFRRLMELMVLPENSTVVNGKDVTMECKFTTPAPFCFWGKDGDLMAVRGRYEFAGDRFKGDCSITIRKANLLDEGQWHCGYPRSDTEKMIMSRIAKLSVHVTPSEPVIVVNGIPMGHNEKLFISTLNRPPKISCWSENGKPATDMHWTLSREELLPSPLYIIPYETPLISESTKYGLKISELPFLLDFKQQWQQLNLTCVASHPTYDKEHSTSVHLILGSEIITTATPLPMTTTTESTEIYNSDNCLDYGYNCDENE